MDARRRAFLGLAAGAAVVLAILIGGTVRAVSLYEQAAAARAALEAVARRAEQAGAAVTASDAGAIEAQLAEVDNRLAMLEAALDGDPVVRGATLAPGVATQLDSAHSLLRAARYITSRHAAIGSLLRGYVAARDSPDGLQRTAAFARFVGSMRPQIADLAGAIRAADDLVRTVPATGLVGPLAEARLLVADLLATIRPATDAAAQAADWVPALMGIGGTRRYLVLALDNAETRPVGGLIAAFATPSFRDGVLVDLAFRDIGAIDRSHQRPYVDPPPGLKDHLLGRYPWQVADAGWWPDWERNVAEIRRLYEIETGDSDIQGVIAFTPEVVDRLLTIVGPVEIPEAGVTVHPGETYLVSLEQVEVLNRGEGRKAFLAQLASQVLARILVLPPERLPDVLRELDAAGVRRQLQVSLDDATASARLDDLGWFAPTSFSARADRLTVMDANVAPVSKLNAITSLAHRLEVSIGPDGAATETLRTTYENRFGPEMGPALERVRSTFRSGNLGSYQRRYLDPRATVLSVTSDGDPPAHAPERLASEDGCIVVANYLFIRPGRTTLETRYRVPEVVSAAGGDPSQAGTYTLEFIKQPGRDRDALTVVVRTPPDTRPASWSDGGVLRDGTVVFETSTELDRTFVVSYAQAP